MCSLFHLALGNEDGGVLLIYESACCLARGFIFERRKNRGVVCCLLYFQRRWECMWVYVCVYAHTYTHYTDGVHGCEPRSQEGTPGGPKNPDGLHLVIHIFVHVYKVHMCTYIYQEAG